MNFYFFLTIFFTFLFTNSLIKYSLPLMGDIFKEIPNERSSHESTKLKGGGIFFITTILFINIIDTIYNGSNEVSKIIFLCSFFSLIGLLDDLFSISIKLRYFFHLIFSFLIVNSVYPNLLQNQNYIYLIITIIIGTIVINFINFIDGIDGLLIGCTLPILIFSQFKSLDIQITATIISLIAFLKWNWDPSKIFMGDCGSNFLGLLIFYLILSKDNNLINFKTLFIILPIFLDCSWCILRRFFNKENIFVAHKKHLYQRLNQGGISHGNVALIYIVICFFNLLITKQNNLYIFVFVSIVEISYFLYLDKYHAKKFN